MRKAGLNRRALSDSSTSGGSYRTKSGLLCSATPHGAEPSAPRTIVSGARDTDITVSGSDDGDLDRVDGGENFDVCLFGAGDEISNCEY